MKKQVVSEADIRLFLDFIEGLVDYSPPDWEEGLGTIYKRFVLFRYLENLMRRAELLVSKYGLHVEFDRSKKEGSSMPYISPRKAMEELVGGP